MSRNKSKKYYFELQARGYELDSYGHVNNAVFLNYAEQARWDLFNRLGLLDQLITDEKKIVIVENNFQYRKQVKLFDEIVVVTQMEKSSNFLLFRHVLINKKTEKPVTRAMVKTVFLDKNNKPCDIPKSLLDTFTAE